MEETTPSHKHKKVAYSLWLPVAVAAVVCGAGGFAVGMQYQKDHQNAGVATAGTAANGRFGGGFGQQGARGIFGEVTAVSPSSITVTETRNNTTETLSITSSTAVTKDGAAATAGDIATGDQVLVQASASNSNEAARIIIDPSMPGGMGGRPQQGSSDTTQTQTN